MSKCDLIRDLLPLYVDGAASKESARAVEEHVATCYECRRALQDMRAKKAPCKTHDAFGPFETIRSFCAGQPPALHGISASAGRQPV